MDENKSIRNIKNAALILILTADLFMITMWVLSSLGVSPIPNEPAFLQITGFLLVLLASVVSLLENNGKTGRKE